MRDQDTGEYLVQALGGAPGASSHLLATLAEANCLVVVPSRRRSRSAPARSSTSPFWPSAADRGPALNSVADQFRASGMADAGRSAAGGRRHGPAAARCGCATRRSGAGSGWPIGRASSRGSRRPTWIGCAPCGFVVAAGVLGASGRGAQGPHAAVRDRTRRPVLRAADDRERHARCAAVGVDRLLGGQRGHRRRSGDRRAGAGSGSLFRAGDAAPGRGDGATRRTRRVARCWPRSGSARRGCCCAISTSTGRGATTCWWRSRSRKSRGRWRRGLVHRGLGALGLTRDTPMLLM